MSEPPRTWVATSLDREKLGVWNVLRSTTRCPCCRQEIVLDTLLVSREDALDLLEFGVATCTAQGRLRPREGRSVNQARQILSRVSLPSVARKEDR